MILDRVNAEKRR